MPMAHRTLIASHRGGSYLWPENSLMAFRETAKLAVDQVEFDVQLSADDECVVIHDPMLDRTTDARGPVRGRTLAELRRIRLRGAHGECIPTLAEVVAVYRNSPILLRVEIKADAERIHYPGIGPRVLDVLEKEGALSRAAITSFQAPMVATIRDTGRFGGALIWLCAPQVWRDIGMAAVFGTALDCGASGVGIHHSLLNDDVLAAARAAGLSPGAWGLREESDIQRVLDLAVDVFTSDDPVTSLKLRG
ncbi:glycerophosphodiester phosphodiesterase family protein [Roseomonas sp. CAU 1739]|uniref:glycerophosphodiester phosphodiesterase family protein n=1 Tax=Roseomonas sp. CAU 1739 TaxID=3140364 RepID=UPI00325B105C